MLLARYRAPLRASRGISLRMSLWSFPGLSPGASIGLFSVASLCAALGSAPLRAQAVEPPSVVVTVTSVAQPAFDTPAAVDVVSGRTLKEGQRGVNLSETLARVPGLNIADRQNYAQDLQISSRGFGARSTFGVRGIRLYRSEEHTSELQSL